MPPQKQPTRDEFVKSLFALEAKDNFHTDARKRLAKGIAKGVEIVSMSYGAAGSNTMVEEDLYPLYRTTNDGKMMLANMRLADPVENMGLNILKEVADKTDKESGDGRKSTVILTGAIIEEGMKSEENPMAIKRSMDDCLPIIIRDIEDNTSEILPENVGTVAEIASESPKLGALFQEIYSKIGRDGVVNLDNSGTPDTWYDLIEGVRLLNCGFMWPYMANEDKGRQAVYKFPKVLITKQKISSLKEIDGILRAVSTREQRDELVIFCNEIDPAVSAAMAYLHLGQTPDGKPVQPFKTLVIKAPTLWKDWLFEDFARITGATVIDPAQGRSLKNFNLTYLGSCEKIVTSKDETIVVGIKDISDHIKVLEESDTDDSRLRIARLRTKTATLKLGANSDTELAYLAGKALDARNASHLALNGGVVDGGGIALYRASKKLPKTVGGKILAKALQYPAALIVDNMGIKMDLDKDTFGDKVLDPANVVKNSITNAISVASVILTTRTAITKIKQ